MMKWRSLRINDHVDNFIGETNCIKQQQQIVMGILQLLAAATTTAGDNVL